MCVRERVCVNLRSSQSVRQTGYGWFHGVSRVICDGYYIGLVVDHPHWCGLASFLPSFLPSPQRYTCHGLHRPFLLRRTKVARRHGVPRPRLLPLFTALSHRRLGLTFTSQLGDGGTRADHRKKGTAPRRPSSRAASLSTRVRARQTGATIGSILIGSGRTRGAPPRFEVCDVSIIMVGRLGLSCEATAKERGRMKHRRKGSEGRTVAYPGKVRR